MPVVCMTVTQTRGALLVDVSSWGVRLRGSNPPHVGEQLSISFGPVRAFGTVAWVRKDDFGVHFDAPVSAADLRSIL